MFTSPRRIAYMYSRYYISIYIFDIDSGITRANATWCARARAFNARGEQFNT